MKFKSNRVAFGLVELSIVITVVSILVGGYLSYTTGAVNDTKKRYSRDSLQVVYRSIGNFLAKNKRLPCPASLKKNKLTDSDYGNEVAGCSGVGLYQSSTNSNLVYGMVPSKTIGLSTDYSEDSYGSKIVYVIDKRFAITSETVPNFLNSTFSTTPSNSIITIKSKSGGGDTTLLNDAIVVLISYGANKYGSFDNISLTQNPRSGNSEELNNDATSFSDGTPSSASYDNTFYVSSTLLSGFDDIVLYKKKSDFINDFSLLNLIACENAGTNFTIRNAYYEQVLYSNTTCSTVEPNRRVAKRCEKDGSWKVTIGCNYCVISGITGITSSTVSVGSGNVACNGAGYTGSLSYNCLNDASYTTSGSCGSIICPVSVTGISTPSSVNYGVGSLSCNQIGYTGSISYNCGSSAILSTTGLCNLVTCPVAVTGISSPSSVTYGNGTLTCNTTGYTGSISYNCSASGAFTPTGTCPLVTCPVSVTGISSPSTVNYGSSTLVCNATGYTGAISYNCSASGILSTTGSCPLVTCPVSVTGVSSPSSVNYGSGNLTCNVAGYTGTVGYNCSASGVLSITGSCPTVNCPISVTGVASPTSVGFGSGNLTCNATGYTGSVSYNCGSNGTATITGSCTSQGWSPSWWSNGACGGYIAGTSPNSVTIVGPQCGWGDSFQAFAYLPSWASRITFNWSYYTNDGDAYWDPAYLYSNNNWTLLINCCGRYHGGYFDFGVGAGSQFGLAVNSVDGCCGQGVLTFSNINLY